MRRLLPDSTEGRDASIPPPKRSKVANPNDASTTVHEVDRIVNSSWDPKLGRHSYLVHYKNCPVEEREWTTWIEGCESKVVDYYELEFMASVYHDSQYQRCIGQGVCIKNRSGNKKPAKSNKLCQKLQNKSNKRTNIKFDI